MQRSTFAILALLVLAQPAGAGQLAPKLASHLVNLVGTGASPCPDGGLQFDVQIDAAGRLSRFTIPEGFVLVLDYLSWSVSGPDRGVKTITLRLGPTNVWASSAGDQDTLEIGKSEPLPNIAVRGPNTLCYYGFNSSINSARLHGFLVKDL